MDSGSLVCSNLLLAALANLWLALESGVMIADSSEYDLLGVRQVDFGVFDAEASGDNRAVPLKYPAFLLSVPAGDSKSMRALSIEDLDGIKTGLLPAVENPCCTNPGDGHSLGLDIESTGFGD